MIGVSLPWNKKLMNLYTIVKALILAFDFRRNSVIA
jgi:hypothetical protein